MREDVDEGGLGVGRDLAALREAAGQRQVGADHRDRPRVDQILELRQAVASLAEGDRDVDVPGDVFERGQALRGDRVFVVEEAERLELAREQDRLVRREVAVDLDPEVDAVADRLAHRRDDLGRRADVGRRRLLLPVGQEGHRPDGQIAGLDRRTRALGMFGDGVAGDGGEHLDALPAGAAEQRVHGLAHRLPEDVPERDVDGAQRREEHRAGEVGIARHRLEVMLDPPRVLAAEILLEIVDRLEDQAVVRPEAGLAGADDAVARVHLHEQAPVHEKRRDAVDLHRCASAVIGPLPPARRSRRSRYARRSRAGRRRGGRSRPPRCVTGRPAICDSKSAYTSAMARFATAPSTSGRVPVRMHSPNSWYSSAMILRSVVTKSKS